LPFREEQIQHPSSVRNFWCPECKLSIVSHCEVWSSENGENNDRYLLGCAPE
jgi:hypothetical protein